MLVSTESQQQPAITKHNINAMYTCFTHFPFCKLFYVKIFPRKDFASLQCVRVHLECSWNLAMCSLRCSLFLNLEMEMQRICCMSIIQAERKNVNYLTFRFTSAIILSLAKVALKSPLVSTVRRFVLENVLMFEKGSVNYVNYVNYSVLSSQNLKSLEWK